MTCARRPLLTLFNIGLGSLLLTSTPPARAADDCPPGARPKTEDGFSWCEPTVCSNEVPCRADEVCRPIALCMQVGTLGDAGDDAGQRLVVTQRCVAGEQPGDPKTCPQKQTCSDMNRCITKTAADKLGLLDLSSTASATPAPGAQGETKKSSCGCAVIGAGDGTGGGIALGAGLASFAARRRRRRIAADPRLEQDGRRYAIRARRGP